MISLCNVTLKGALSPREIISVTELPGFPRIALMTLAESIPCVL